MSEFANNESAFDALLESIKQVSNNIKRDAGTRFETLIKDWLTQDPSYCDLFSNQRSKRSKNGLRRILT